MALGDKNAMANINSQTKNQRSNFAKNTNFGANRSAPLLFNNTSIDEATGIVSIDDTEINSLANTTLQSSYDSIQGNPDFLDLGNIDYTGTETMMGSVADAIDKPALKGPNLVVPSIDADGEVIDQAPANTAYAPVTGRGFGVNLDRHTPGNSPTIGSYLKRRLDDDGEVQVPKGEYVDEDKYSWEE